MVGCGVDGVAGSGGVKQAWRGVRQERFGLFWTGVNGARLGRAGIVVAGEVGLTGCVEGGARGRMAGEARHVVE